MNISVLERLLNEGQAVDAEVKSIIKTILPEDMRDTAVGYINKLPWVKRSQNGKDAIPTAKWLVSMAGNISWDRAVRQLGRLIQLKDRLNTTKRMDLAKLYDQYPTYDQLKEFLDDEKEKLANGWKDDFGMDVDVVDDDPDEVRMQRIRKDLGKPTFSTPGVVDIYRADTQAEAIRLGNGYSWCISYTTGDNYFYHYRMNPTSTAYFCFFNEPQPEYDDVACVIHVGENGDYRMTNAQNDNGSPIVDEERVVYCYPPLEKWLPKMTVVGLSDKEVKFSKVKKDAGDEWLDLGVDFAEKGKWSRSDWRMMISMGAGLSDELFDWILNRYDHGKFNDKDSLINLYVKVTAYPLTKHQEEIVSKNRSLLNFYKERHDGKIEELAQKYMENLIEEGVYDPDTLEVEEGSHITFIARTPDYPIANEVEELTISPLCQSLFGVPDAYELNLSGNKYIERIDVRGLETNIDLCGAARVAVIECCNLELVSCKRLERLELRCLEPARSQDIKVKSCPELEVISGLDTFDSEEYVDILLRDLPKLHSVDSAPSEVYELIIEKCPNLDLGFLGNIDKIEGLGLPIKSAVEFDRLLSVIEGVEIHNLHLACDPDMDDEDLNYIRDKASIYENENDTSIWIVAGRKNESLMSPLNRLGYVLKGLHE